MSSEYLCHRVFVCCHVLSLLSLGYFFLSLKILFYGCGVLQACLCTIWMQCLRRPEGGVRSTGARVEDSCEPPCGSGTWTQVFCKNEQLVLILLSHLSGIHVRHGQCGWTTVKLRGSFSPTPALSGFWNACLWGCEKWGLTGLGPTALSTKTKMFSTNHSRILSGWTECFPMYLSTSLVLPVTESHKWTMRSAH